MVVLFFFVIGNSFERVLGHFSELKFVLKVQKPLLREEMRKGKENQTALFYGQEENRVKKGRFTPKNLITFCVLHSSVLLLKVTSWRVLAKQRRAARSASTALRCLRLCLLCLKRQ